MFSERRVRGVISRTDSLMGDDGAQAIQDMLSPRKSEPTTVAIATTASIVGCSSCNDRFNALQSDWIALCAHPLACEERHLDTAPHSPPVFRMILGVAFSSWRYARLSRRRNVGKGYCRVRRWEPLAHIPTRHHSGWLTLVFAMITR